MCFALDRLQTFIIIKTNTINTTLSPWQPRNTKRKAGCSVDTRPGNRRVGRLHHYMSFPEI